MINTYDIGDRVRLTGTFTNKLTAQLADPATVVILIKAPDGTESSVSYDANPSVGVYYYDMTTTMSGTYTYRFKGTASVIAAGENFFKVRESAFDTP